MEEFKVLTQASHNCPQCQATVLATDTSCGHCGMELAIIVESIAPEPAGRICPHCNGGILPSAIFCGHCGNELEAGRDYLREDIFNSLSPTLLYYFVTLILLATYKFTDLFPGGIEGFIWVSAIDIFITVGFWLNNSNELAPLFSFRGFSFRVFGLTILGAVVGSIVVSVVANVINLSIQDDVFYSTYMFEDTSHPFLYSVIGIAVLPAIFEEVAFRGFIFNNLKKISSPVSVIYITSFVFGIVHLQVISLMWLVPIGLAFAFLRNKYETLWYGIAGHFVYNFCITGYEFLGWF